jgi:hypothetical protein
MKIKQLLNLALLFFVINANAQELNQLDKKITNSFLVNEHFTIKSPKDAEVFEDLKFIGYEKLETSKFEFAKLLIPKIIIVDSKQGDDDKKNGKRIEYLKKYKTYDASGNLLDGLKISNLKFDFNNSEEIILGNKQYNAINVSEKVYKSFSFDENVIAKYKAEKSNKNYYVIKNKNFYYIIDESEYNKPISEREIKFEEAKQVIEQFKISKLREQSKNWVNGNFSKIFPEDKIFLYNVSYFFKGETSTGDDISEHKVNALALSNINPSSISKEDFPKNEELNLTGYKHIKDYNVVDLLYNKKTPLDSVFYKKPSANSWFSDWKKGVSVNPILDSEKDAVLGGEINTSKYSADYFLKKIKNKDIIGKEPLFLTATIAGNEIVFETVTATVISAGNDYFKVNHYGGLGLIKGFDDEGSDTYLERSFDTRIDKPNFNFVTVDSGFFREFASNYSGEYARQINKENIEELIALESSKTITRFYDYLKETKKKDIVSNQNKQLLINKFGAKYTNEALNGNIIVGMPEGLLPIPLKLWKITSRSKWNNGYKIYCTSYLDSSAKLSVYVQNGKVTYVSY